MGKKVEINLVEEAHKAISQLSKTREDFTSGKLGIDQASVHVGLFNATSRILNTAVAAEKWEKAKSDSGCMI